MAWVHLRGVGPGRIVGNVLAALKVSALLMFIALGFSIGGGSSTNLAASTGPVVGSAWLLALIPVMFTYSGWNAAGYIAEEIRDPGPQRSSRICPRHGCCHRDLCRAEHPVSIRVAGRRAGKGAGQRSRRDRRSPARRASGRHHGHGFDHQPCGQHQRDDVCRSPRLLRDGARRVVFRCCGESASDDIARLRRQSSRRQCGRVFWCFQAAPMR